MKRIYCLVCATAMSGCYSDSHWRRDETLHKLDVLAEIVKKWGPIRIKKFTSVEEFVSRSDQEGYLTDLSGNSFELDGWGKSFSWHIEIDKEQNRVRVRIISGGVNQVLENGEHDDLFVEIELTFLGESKAFLHGG